MEEKKKSKIIFPLLLASAALLLSACASDEPKNLTAKSQLNGIPYTTPGSNINKIRMEALTDSAKSLSAQKALYWGSCHINRMLKQQERQLDEVFNFNALLLKDNVLPPVLTEGTDPLKLEDDQTTIRLADHVYRIEIPPRFVTTPPSWREYLWMNYPQPEEPSAALLPRDDKERAIWNSYVVEGWKDGIQQSNQIFMANMGRLKRDYSGMILYRKLLAQKMVTPPYVGKTDLGVTGDEHEMRVNDQVLRITSTSRLVPNSKEWNAVVTPGVEGAVRKQGPQGEEGTKTLE